jgi:hypothetical protein
MQGKGRKVKEWRRSWPWSRTSGLDLDVDLDVDVDLDADADVDVVVDLVADVVVVLDATRS